MKAAELVGKSIGELNTTLTTLRRKLFKLRLVKASGELVKTHEIKETRRNIARVTTMIAKEGKKT
ncbi:MAG TPA: 50S ribosomal protein L29 [Gammaproteobacteria bacterium]|nr:50S ribosomal protein L29 [Gammaproteobacteria bacterium]HQY22363.1 50S ribosomal protein L29 [Gammaproteobacteria bacterium]HQZ88046.1 50S ribosomal protein L29 [Gammaproteobacteria bacterium]HRA42503.1 50S ribosomal protein L29 [Gammaproteobacteria bacterium]